MPPLATNPAANQPTHFCPKLVMVPSRHACSSSRHTRTRCPTYLCCPCLYCTGYSSAGKGKVSIGSEEAEMALLLGRHTYC